MLTCVRWYLAYPLSLRHVEEMMQERGVFVDHSTVRRWTMKILSVLAVIFRWRKRDVGSSWRMDETYIKVAGQWKYLYRAVRCSSSPVLPFALAQGLDQAMGRYGVITDRAPYSRVAPWRSPARAAQSGLCAHSLGVTPTPAARQKSEQLCQLRLAGRFPAGHCSAVLGPETPARCRSAQSRDRLAAWVA